jgi:hypothetical protein
MRPKHKFDITTLCTFASPRVGNREFSAAIQSAAHRFVADCEYARSWFRKLPPYIPLLLDYNHVDSAYPFCSSSFAKNSLVIWHAMETTLHWLETSTTAQQGG